VKKRIQERRVRNLELGQRDAFNRCAFCRRALPMDKVIVVTLSGQKFCNDDCVKDAEERDQVMGQ
jgi:hypothetical protein